MTFCAPDCLDDAGGGQRGMRPRITPELVGILRQRYGLVLATPDTDLGGSVNLNVLVTDGRELFVARAYRRHVTEARLAAIQDARRALAAAGVPAPLAVRTRAGESWTRVGENLIEVEPFVASDSKMDDGPRFELGLRMLARVHAVLAGVEVLEAAASAVFANYISAADGLAATRRGTARMRAWGASQEELRLADAANRLAEQLAAKENDAISVLVHQLVHGDFWDNNVLFRDGAIVLVTDFDFMGARPRIDDVALPLYYIGLSLLRRGTDDGALMRTLSQLLDAYDGELGHHLAENERAALPLAICRQPLWSFAVWIAGLDDERAARAHAAGMQAAVDWGLRVALEPERWQAAFV